MSLAPGLAFMDNLLLTFIEAPDEEQADYFLTKLIDEQATPIIKEILGVNLRIHVDSSGRGASRQDAGDLFNDIVANVIARLRQIRQDPGQDNSIVDFRGYVAATSYNACNLYLRKRFPRRSRLKNRLRYLLSHDDDFALWTSETSGLLCGFARWRDQDAYAPPGLLEKIRQDTGAWIQEVGLTNLGVGRAQLTTLLHATFRWCESPVKLDELVNVVAVVSGEKDLPDESLETAMDVAAPAINFEMILEQQYSLALLWQEICQLPLRQRIALLLNFRDASGYELISLLPYTRTATIEQIADLLEFPLAEFLKLWNELPLDDIAIAQLMGGTRQQVINLRKCARERLARRMNSLMVKSPAGK